MSEEINYNAFHEQDGEVKNNQSLKINNKRSRFATPEKSANPTAVEFDRAVADYKTSDIDITNKIAELTLQFRSCVTDRTLKGNQSPVKKDLEQKVIRELTTIGLALDGDSTKPEGIGSMGMISMLMQTILTQRDHINGLSYNIDLLAKKIAKLESDKSSKE